MQSADSPTDPISHSSYYLIDSCLSISRLYCPLPNSLAGTQYLRLILYSFHSRCHIHSQCLFYYKFPSSSSEQQSDPLKSHLCRHGNCLCAVIKDSLLDLVLFIISGSFCSQDPFRVQFIGNLSSGPYASVWRHLGIFFSGSFNFFSAFFPFLPLNLTFD